MTIHKIKIMSLQKKLIPIIIDTFYLPFMVAKSDILKMNFTGLCLRNEIVWLSCMSGIHNSTVKAY